MQASSFAVADETDMLALTRRVRSGSPSSLWSLASGVSGAASARSCGPESEMRPGSVGIPEPRDSPPPIKRTELPSLLRSAGDDRGEDRGAHCFQDSRQEPLQENSPPGAEDRQGSLQEKESEVRELEEHLRLAEATVSSIKNQLNAKKRELDALKECHCPAPSCNLL